MSGLTRVVYLTNGHEGRRLYDWFNHFHRHESVITHLKLYDSPVDWSDVGDYDLGIGFMYSHKIPADQVHRPKWGWVNFHPAPLPEYRGRNVAYHAIAEGAAEYGATVHYMDAQFDTGEVIEVSRFPIEPVDTAGDIWNRSVSELVRLFKKWVPQLLKGKVHSTPQGHGVYYRKGEISNEVELNEHQERLVRALTFHPKHHAVITIGGKKYKIVPED